MRLVLTSTVLAVTMFVPAKEALAEMGCVNNLKQIGLGLLPASSDGVADIIAASGPGTTSAIEVKVCSDASYAYLSVGDLAPIRAQLRGCSAAQAGGGLNEKWFPPASAVSSRKRADGSVEIRVASSEYRGCVASAIVPAAALAGGRLGVMELQATTGPDPATPAGATDLSGGAPVPGIEGSPIGTVGTPRGGDLAPAPTITLPDLLPVNGLRLASKLIPWGQSATISTDEASAKQGGRCSFRYRYETTNQGQAAAGPAANMILLDSENGPALAQDALPGLPVAALHASSGTLQLVPGTWILYVHVDGQAQVIESDEQNNLRRVQVQVNGKCD